MSVMDWLAERVGFNLPESDRQAILEFALLYSLFEAKALNEDGNPQAIIAAVERWQVNGRLAPELFQVPTVYFMARYFPNGQEAASFAHLKVSDLHRPRVSGVLSGENEDTKDRVIAVLLVVNRLRNNLAHGAKWAYDLEGQRDNFQNANLALMAALDCNGMNE